MGHVLVQTRCPTAVNSQKTFQRLATTTEVGGWGRSRGTTPQAGKLRTATLARTGGHSQQTQVYVSTAERLQLDFWVSHSRLDSGGL